MRRPTVGAEMPWLLLVILLIALLFGGYGSTAGWGPVGWSPLGLVLLIVVVLLLVGALR